MPKKTSDFMVVEIMKIMKLAALATANTHNAISPVYRFSNAHGTAHATYCIYYMLIMHYVLSFYSAILQ